MDVVEFAEKFMNVELFECQKKFLKDLEDFHSKGDVYIRMSSGGRVYIYLDRKTQKELIQYGKTSHCHN